MGSVHRWPNQVFRCFACGCQMACIARFPGPREYHCYQKDCSQFAISWKLSFNNEGETVLEEIGRILPANGVSVPNFQEMGMI